MSHTLCHTLYVTHSIPHTLFHTLYVTHSMSHTPCHTLYVTHSIPHTLFLKFRNISEFHDLYYLRIAMSSTPHHLVYRYSENTVTFRGHHVYISRTSVKFHELCFYHLNFTNCAGVCGTRRQSRGDYAHISP